MCARCEVYYDFLKCFVGNVARFRSGVATFTSLFAKCAPGHTLYLAVRTSVDGVNEIQLQVKVDFRSCVRGEYFAEGQCNKCESGSFSLVEPEGIALGDLRQTDVCQPCVSHARCPGGDEIVLNDG